MNHGTKRWLDTALRLSPAQPIFDRAASRRLGVLAYHGVEDPERFGQHLDHLRRTSRVVALSEVLDSFEGKRPLPSRAILITFDDGHRSLFDHAMPMLRDRGMPAVAFVIVGVIDSDEPYWWSEVIDLARRGATAKELRGRTPEDLVRMLKRVPDQRRRKVIEQLRRSAPARSARMSQLTTGELRSLESAGVAIGNHTWSHPCLPRCDEAVSKQEIEASHRVLTQMIGHHPEVFAYPNGDYDGGAAAVLRRCGYRAAFLFDHRLSEPRPRDPFAVSRLRVNSTTSVDRFRTISSGLHPTIHRVRGRG